MEIGAILLLIEKGITVIGALVEAGKSAGPAIQATLDLARGAQTGDVTPEQMTATETLLDAQIEEFNLDIE